MDITSSHAGGGGGTCSLENEFQRRSVNEHLPNDLQNVENTHKPSLKG